MRKFGSQSGKIAPSLALAVAVAIIGCGGGGGGGSRSATVTGGSSSGGAITTGGDGTAGGMTTGQITTGGTTGSEVTTGTSGTDTTGSTGATDTSGTDGTTGTDGTIDPTTGSVGTTGSTDGTTTGTDGNTGTDGSTTGTTGDATTGTTGDATTGTTGATTGGTTADPTTGGTTADPTTGSATTGSSTTGTTGTDGSSTGTTGTTGSTTGGSTGGGTLPAGSLRANAIYFGHWSDTSLISSVLPDGTGRQDQGGLTSAVVAAAPDPDNAGKFVYAALSGSTYGIYRGSTFSTASSTTLVTPQFTSVTMIQGSLGTVAFIAEKNGVNRVYLLSDGTLRNIDVASSAALSADGTQVAYTKTQNGFENLYVWSAATGTSRLLVANKDSLFPSFSKDGTYVLFSSNRSGAESPWDLYQIPSAGGTSEQITNTPLVSEFGGCYNESRTMVSYVAFSSDDALAGVFVVSNTGSLRVAADIDVNQATYWTNSQGRSSRIRGARFQSLSIRKARR
ncbi:hypothetical protein EON82_08430 [bacterium]|nr:MAG: hypothetical protein EON82_08430 [bacterium]